MFAEHTLDSTPRLIAWPDRDAIPGLGTAAGRVVVQFVVDTSGSIEPETMELLAVSDSAVLPSAAAFLAGSRFRGGQVVPGRRVRALIQRELIIAGLAILVRGPRDTVLVRW